MGHDDLWEHALIVTVTVSRNLCKAAACCLPVCATLGLKSGAVKITELEMRAP